MPFAHHSQKRYCGVLNLGNTRLAKLNWFIYSLGPTYANLQGMAIAHNICQALLDHKMLASGIVITIS